MWHHYPHLCKWSRRKHLKQIVWFPITRIFSRQIQSSLFDVFFQSSLENHQQVLKDSASNSFSMVRILPVSQWTPVYWAELHSQTPALHSPLFWQLIPSHKSTKTEPTMLRKYSLYIYLYLWHNSIEIVTCFTEKASEVWLTMANSLFTSSSIPTDYCSAHI